MMLGRTLDELSLGDAATFSKTISETDVYLFAGITGDFNPAHVDEEYARQTAFKGRIAHGMLTAGLISHILGMKLPGPGAIYVRQELRFLAPVRIGDTITARAEVIEIMAERKLVRMRTTCTNQGGTLVLDGEAVLSPRRAARTIPPA
ncbi:MAG: MaoC family dehydratase [Syntrophobacteraceae bacterium]|jgi:3-hydroxybutyryl-CoA dehydratase|nr:MaoC family dehydratase [Syntrophobacteraceae bacterium]